MVVLLVGDSNFTEFELVEQAVEEGGADVVMCDTCDWPDGPPVEFSPSKDSFTIGDGVDIDDVTGIFSMYQTVFQELHTEYIDWYDGENSFPRSINQLREWRSFFQSLIRVCDERDATVVPTKEVYNWNLVRPWMLDRFRQEGVPVPDTIFTNDPESIRSFVSEHEKAVYMFVNGGAPPQILTEEKLDEQQLEKLSSAPIKCQAYAPGDDVRVYVVDGEVVGTIIYQYEEDTFSFKNADTKTISVDSYSLPPTIRESALRAASVTSGVYAAIDVRVNSPYDYYVLEANVPGRFAQSDSDGITNVSGALADQLI